MLVATHLHEPHGEPRRPRREFLGRGNSPNVEGTRVNVRDLVQVPLIINKGEFTPRVRKGGTLDAVPHPALLARRRLTVRPNGTLVSASRLDEHGSAGLRPCGDTDEVAIGTVAARLQQRRRGAVVLGLVQGYMIPA